MRIWWLQHVQLGVKQLRWAISVRTWEKPSSASCLPQREGVEVFRTMSLHRKPLQQAAITKNSCTVRAKYKYQAIRNA